MRTITIAAAIAGMTSLPALVHAQAAATASPHSFSGNLTFVSDYRFRGLSQTFLKPAVQGGFDYSHASGFYLGTWGSNVSGNQYPNGSSMEWDFYGGYKMAFGDFGLDVGLLQYWYPGTKFVHGDLNGDGLTNDGDTKADTLEIYVGGSWKWLTLKYSHTLSHFFGVKTETLGGSCGIDGSGNAYNTTNAPEGCIGATPGKSRGSGYLDLTASVPIAEKLTLTAHVGHQKVKNYDKLDYTDWKIGVTYDLNGWLLGAAYVDTNANKPFYRAVNGAGNVEEIGKSTLVVSVGKTF